MERLDDIPRLPEQPNLAHDQVIDPAATKRAKKKLREAAEPRMAKVPAVTSRRVRPILPPVAPTNFEIFKGLVVKHKLKGEALHKKASDVVDDRGRLNKPKASWLTQKGVNGAYFIPEKLWSGTSHVKNPAAANTVLLNAAGNIRQRCQKVRVQPQDATGHFTTVDSSVDELTELGNEKVHRTRVLGEVYGDGGGLKRESGIRAYLEWVEKTVSTMKNNQTMFEEGMRNVAATAMRKIQKESNQLTQDNRRLNKHIVLLRNLISEFGGEAPEMETAAAEWESSPPPNPKTAKKQYLSVVIHFRSGRKLMIPAQQTRRTDERSQANERCLHGYGCLLSQYHRLSTCEGHALPTREPLVVRDLSVGLYDRSAPEMIVLAA
jgi:hypothetical protein